MVDECFCLNGLRGYKLVCELNIPNLFHLFLLVVLFVMIEVSFEDLWE